MKALHIKTFCVVNPDGGQLYVDLQYRRTGEGDEVAAMARVSRRTKKTEKFLGYAHLNTVGELIHLPEGLTAEEAERIDAAILEALT